MLNRRRNASWLQCCERVGQQTRLQGRPTIEARGGGRIRIGDRFRLASTPVPSHLAAGPNAILEIGDDVSIAHGAAIAAFEHVRIGHGTLIGPFVIVMDTNFHGAGGDQSVRHDCRPIVIGDGCRIGSRVTITRGVSIGAGAEILAGSVVTSSIPPGLCAGGARARIVGRAGQAAARWDGAGAVFPELVMTAFGLDDPPELATDPSKLPRSDDPGVQRLLAAIADRFGVVLDANDVRTARTLGELSERVQLARLGL